MVIGVLIGVAIVLLIVISCVSIEKIEVKYDDKPLKKAIKRKDEEIIYEHNMYDSVYPTKDYTGMIIISFLIPIVGLIIYAVNISIDPELAKIAGKSALISVCLYLFILVIICLLPYMV